MNRVSNPATTALYRRVLRIRHKIEDIPLKRKFVFNVREWIALYAYPERCFNLPLTSSSKREALSASTLNTFNPTRSSSANIAANAGPNLASSTGGQIPSLLTATNFDFIISEKIRNAHKDLDLLECILENDSDLLSNLLPSFTMSAAVYSKSSDVFLEGLEEER